MLGFEFSLRVSEDTTVSLIYFTKLLQSLNVKWQKQNNTFTFVAIVQISNCKTKLWPQWMRPSCLMIFFWDPQKYSLTIRCDFGSVLWVGGIFLFYRTQVWSWSCPESPKCVILKFTRLNLQWVEYYEVCRESQTNMLQAEPDARDSTHVIAF